LISLDALFPDKVVFSATPDLYPFSHFFNIKRIEMPSPFSDHFSFVTEGYPAMVLYNDDLIPFYHSNKDLPIEGDKQYLSDLVNSLTHFLVELDKYDKDKLDESFIKYVKSQGYDIKERRGSIVPNGLTSTFKKSQ